MHNVLLYRAKWVKVSGVLYKEPCALLIGVKDDYPQFGKLIGIFVLNCTRITFLVQIMETDTFASHYHAYVVSNTPVCHVILHSNLYSLLPMHIHHITHNSTIQQVIVPKYHITGCLF